MILPSRSASVSSEPTTLSQAAVGHERQMLELHRLLADGKGETEEHEALCESMLESWNELDAATRERFRRLSGDLYMLQGAEVLEPSDEDPDVLALRLQDAWAQKDYVRVLSLLRKVQEPFPLDRVAYVRGRCWAELGFHEAALAFFAHASKLNPTNGNYAYLVLQKAISLGRAEEAIAGAKVIAADPKAPSHALFAAAHALLRVPPTGRTLDPDLYERVIHILHRALALERALPPPRRVRSVLVGGYVELGLCYEHLGKSNLAQRAYTDALQIDPDSDAALTARGLLLSSSNPTVAVVDFERAVAVKTPLVWPYLHLVPRYLLAGEYARAAELCEMGMERTTDPSPRANFYEWLALAKAALFEPRELVEQLFEKALDLAPLNLRIRRNKQFALEVEPPESGERPWRVESDTPDEEARDQFRMRVMATAA